ncbi:gamma-interferon-inducible protein 16 [Alligator mississippiensis]|uniref:Gamma-interferon-inducible protein 16 n=1 Tax=Alligator mississippiensis TaxID=8496 RepID=A0A151MYP9_ALLMI|nr:gamma-interferon-inducible protein 16 [Alligator mississippiensis]
MIQHFDRKQAVTTTKRILRDLHLKEALNIMIEKAKKLSKAKGKKSLEKKPKSHPAKNTGQNTGSCKNQRTKNEMIKEPFVAKVIKVTKPLKYRYSDVKEKRLGKGYTCFTVTDDTGEIEVMVFDEVGNVKAAEGDKLQLTWFKRNVFNSKLQLKSEMHSRIQVKKQRKK